MEQNSLYFILFADVKSDREVRKISYGAVRRNLGRCTCC